MKSGISFLLENHQGAEERAAFLAEHRLIFHGQWYLPFADKILETQAYQEAQSDQSFLKALNNNWVQTHGLGIPFKGFHLDQLLYQGQGKRYFGDLDFLLAPNKIEKALEQAKKQGYTISEYSQKIGVHASLSHLDGLSLDLGQHKQVIELHVRCFGGPWIALNKCLEPNANQKTWAKEEYLIYLLLHGHKHHWSRLAWLWDWFNVWQQMGEEKALALVRKHKLETLCLEVLSLAKYFFSEAESLTLQGISLYLLDEETKNPKGLSRKGRWWFFDQTGKNVSFAWTSIWQPSAEVMDANTPRLLVGPKAFIRKIYRALCT